MSNVVVLSGAGLSAESGLGTFRDDDGLWSRYPLEEVATPQAFARDPEKVLGFYDLRRNACATAKPNAAHEALARLQQRLGRDLLLVTQNIDDLLERAGARDVVHMHGSVMECRCTRCAFRGVAPRVMRKIDPCPNCAATPLRPKAVCF